VWAVDTGWVSVGSWVHHVGQVMGRAHSLFGTAPAAPQLGSGSSLASAGDLVRGGAATMSGQSGVVAAGYQTFAQDAGPALDHAGATDGSLNGQLNGAATSDSDGRSSSSAVVTAASTDTSTLGPTTGTPAGQRALIAALRGRVAEQGRVINTYHQLDGRLAATLRNLQYARRQGGGAMSMAGLIAVDRVGEQCGVGGVMGVGKRVDPVGPKAAEVVVDTGHDDRGLQVAQAHHQVACVGVGGEVDFCEGQALFLEGFDHRTALHAGRLGVDDDGIHFSTFLLFASSFLLSYC
jgi:hypothetical protein